MLFKAIKICLLLVLLQGTVGEKKWEYEPMSVDTYSTDESQLKIESKIDRINRGEFGLTFTLDWKYDVDETTMVEATAYSSNSGAESDYKLLPWSIPKQPYFDYLDTYYKDVLIKNLGHCSNLPQFKEKFQPPWPKKTYKLEKCIFNGDGLPEVVPPSFYKVIFKISGPNQPEWGVTIVVKIKTKLF
ncbi:uncharacterized protein LOC111071389 [Drosophila obscura]|uniref:uncharacterized protein LOC111071389 n=1 Tax=Drosophila obscura TaxID=7282 RepID=UPI000BA13E52|nr:uncharacterized protein LOC111071389 [Drosophila obscura]